MNDALPVGQIILQSVPEIVSPEKIKVSISRELTEDEIEYWKKVNNPSEKINDTATQIFEIDEMRELIKKRGEKILGGDFVIDKHNQDVIDMLILYFTNSPDFERMNPDFSLRKGIMLRSHTPGTGKTILMKVFARSLNWNDGVQFKSFDRSRLINCKRVVSSYRKNGEDVFAQFEEVRKPEFLSVWTLDELGREDVEAQYYGNKCNVIQRIMQERYDLFIDQKIKTHCTTNIVNRKDFQQLYGDFIVSRMREMFNVITLPGNDRRR